MVRKETIFLKQEAGFATAIAMIVSATLLITFAGVLMYMRTTSRTTVLIDNNDSSVVIANSGVREVINKLRVNPDLKDLDSQVKSSAGVDVYNVTGGIPRNGADLDMFYTIYAEEGPAVIKDNSGKITGKYWAKAKKIDLSQPRWQNIFSYNTQALNSDEIFLIVVNGWAMKDKRANPQTDLETAANVVKVDAGATIHSYVYLPNTAIYFVAVKGDLILQKGADFTGMKVYGERLEFRGIVSDPSNNSCVDFFSASHRIRAETFDYSSASSASFEPPYTSWCGQSVVINGVVFNATRLPQRVAPVVFPGIDEQLTYYELQAASKPYIQQCTFNGAIYPPSRGVNGSGGTSDNRDHIYYCPGEAHFGLTGPVTVNGQIILAADKVVIHSNIRIANDSNVSLIKGVKTNPTYTAPDGGYGPLPSAADQLVLYSKKNVTIDASGVDRWCRSGNSLYLNGILVMASDATLAVEPFPSTETNACMDATDPDKPIVGSAVNIIGAMYVGAMPKLSKYFQTRKYQHLPTLKKDPPPVREFYLILQEFVFRKPSIKPGAVPTPSP